MLDVLKKFIKAERTGNWKLHLQSVLEMIPYMAAAGHNAYTKSSYIYMTNMLDLEDRYPLVYQHFMNGHHTVRRSDRYWSGLSTDLIIEQVLMRSLKTAGGLTRGRGFSEVQRAMWVLSRPACSEMSHAMQLLIGKHTVTKEQHHDCGKARQKKDRQDIEVMLDYLLNRNPFTPDPDLRSISSGVVANGKVNVDSANEV